MINALLTLVVYAIILGVFVWLVHYLVDSIPISDPFGRIAKIGVTIIAVIVLLMLLLNVVNDGTVMPRFR
jgi:hypothetical protein